MTIDTTGLSVDYVANGTSREFTWPWPLVYDDGIAVSITLGDILLPQTLDTDYAVRIETDWQKATVIMNSVPIVGMVVHLVRKTIAEQRFSLPTYGQLPAKTIERALDAFALDLQTMKDGINRALVIPPGAVDGESSYDAKGNRIINVGDPIDDGDAVNKGFIEPFIDSLLPPFDEFTPMRWDFAGNGVATVFAIPGVAASTAEAFFVHVSGVMQTPSADYTISVEDQTITFAAAPPPVEQPGKRNVQIRQMARVFLTAGGSLITATGSTASRSLADHLGTQIHVENYGATDSLTVPAGAKINTAIQYAKSLGGGAVHLARRHLIEQPLVLPSNVWLVPHGQGGTLLKAANGLNGPVITTEGAAYLKPRTGAAQAASSVTLTLAADESSVPSAHVGASLAITAGTGAGQVRRIVSYDAVTKIAGVDLAWTTIPVAGSTYTRYDNPNGPSYFGVLAGLTIDGNRPGNVSGHGIDVYGRAFRIDNPRIHNCAESGIRSEWAYARGAWENDINDLNASAVIVNPLCHNNGAHGIDWQGPPNSRILGGAMLDNSAAGAGGWDGLLIGFAGGGTQWAGGIASGPRHKHGVELLSADGVQLSDVALGEASVGAMRAENCKRLVIGGNVLQQEYAGIPPSAQDLAMAGIILVDCSDVMIDTIVNQCPGGAIWNTGGSGFGRVRIVGSLLAPLAPGSFGVRGALPAQWEAEIAIAGAETMPDYFSSLYRHHVSSIQGPKAEGNGFDFPAAGVDLKLGNVVKGQTRPGRDERFGALLSGRALRHVRLLPFVRIVGSGLVPLTTDGAVAAAGNVLVLEDNTAAYLWGYVVSTLEGDVTAHTGWSFRAMARRVAGVASISTSGTPLIVTDFDTGDVGELTIVVDPVLGAVNLQAQGASGKTLRFMAELNAIVLPGSV